MYRILREDRWNLGYTELLQTRIGCDFDYNRQLSISALSLPPNILEELGVRQARVQHSHRIVSSHVAAVC